MKLKLTKSNLMFQKKVSKHFKVYKILRCTREDLIPKQSYHQVLFLGFSFNASSEDNVPYIYSDWRFNMTQGEIERKTM